MKLLAILVILAAYSILPLASGAQPTAPDQSTSTDQQNPNLLVLDFAEYTLAAP
jgi:hypothetical protein